MLRDNVRAYVVDCNDEKFAIAVSSLVEEGMKKNWTTGSVEQFVMTAFSRREVGIAGKSKPFVERAKRVAKAAKMLLLEMKQECNA